MQIFKKRKCKNCRYFFIPDYRNRNKQEYCSDPACRTASKKTSQDKWLSKEENRDYFRCPTNTLRVQEWRKVNPGYWRDNGKKEPLQDDCNDKRQQNKVVAGQSSFATVTKRLHLGALQDCCKMEHAVLIGLIAQLTGSPLQDDIAKAMNNMRELGQDILSNPNHGGSYVNCQATDLPSSCSERAGELQLVGSPVSERSPP
jgi:hypothetical protein